MTDQQLETILQVIDRIAPKYTFGYYDADDIKQEAYIICCEALEKYDESRPLENFLSKHLSRRLKTFIRNNYSRSNVESENHAKLNESKKNLMDLCSYDGDLSFTEDYFQSITTQEALDIVMENLPPSMRNDFFRVANGVSIQTVKKQALFEKIRSILGEDW